MDRTRGDAGTAREVEMSQQKAMVVRWLRGAGLMLGMYAAMAAAQAQNAIESVTTSMQSGAEVVRIDFTRALSTPPAGFAIQTPARIALDFPGVSNAIGRSAVE